MATKIAPSEKADDSTVHLRLATAKDAAPGERAFRLLGPNGVTPPLRLFISQYPIVHATRSDQPQVVSFPATLAGVISTGGENHRFRFHASAKQRMIFDIAALRSGSPLEAVLTVQSDQGREMRCQLEHHGRDPLLIFDPPDEGDYILQIRDLRYRGGPEYGYRISAGHIPYLEGVIPGSGKPGTVVKARPIGHNLDNAEPISVDLNDAAPGRVVVHARTPIGLSNEIPFEVTDLPQVSESEPNNSVAEANLVTVPVEISANLDAPSDEDFFRFHVPYKQVVSLEVLAGRLGSPVAPLLELRNMKGETIESNDGTADSDARIMRELDSGDYLASVRDLAYQGGLGHWYRLKIEPGQSLRQDFSVRFLPDALRLHRGGSVALWCDVRRINGLKGDVTIEPELLPSGVSSGKITLSADASGWITLSAGPQAKLGTTPIRFRATSNTGAVSVAHAADPANDAYLTVLDSAPFHVETVATLSAQQIDQTNQEIRTLITKLQTPDPKAEAAQAQWEKKFPKQPIWTSLEAKSVQSSKGTRLLRQSDSSVLAHAPFPPQDEYTVVTQPTLKRITAVRLEVLSDASLPARGPGTAPNGNYVLSELTAFASKGDSKQQIGLRDATADFSQPQFPVAAAIDGNTQTGWAIDNQEGRNHVALFRVASAVEVNGATLSFLLRHQSPFPQHNIGRFRISVTDTPDSLLNDIASVPDSVLAIAAIPAEMRDANQKSQIASYYRSIDPPTIEAKNRLAALRQFIAPYAQMRQLQSALSTSTPQLEAEQSQWEQEVARGAAWSLLKITSASASLPLAPEADGSYFASGAGPDTDRYHITGTTTLKGITALRLELLPDPRLPSGGPGRGDEGRFTLTGFRVSTGGSNENVVFRRAMATREAKEAPIASLLSGEESGTWSAGPGAGVPVDATFYSIKPFGGDGGSTLSITLDQLSKLTRNTIGRFRIWVTANPVPEKAIRLPANISTILATAPPARSNVQKRVLGEYFRSIAPSLDPARQRLAELRGSMLAMPLSLRRNQIASIPLLLSRRDGFNGDVTLTLEGFATTRQGGRPPAISKQIKVTPLALRSNAQFGLLTIQPDRTADLATRMVVLKAETKMGDETITEYTPAFPLTVSN